MTVKVEFSINTVDLEVKYLYNHLNAAAICLRTSATQFSATTSISTLEPITGRKSETAIPRNIDGSRIGKTIRRSRYYTAISQKAMLLGSMRRARYETASSLNLSVTQIYCYSL